MKTRLDLLRPGAMYVCGYWAILVTGLGWIILDLVPFVFAFM